MYKKNMQSRTFKDMNRTIKALRFLLKEMTPVILGILIALFLNNYVESRNQQAYLDKVMASINGEFEENMEELKEKIDDQGAFIDLLDRNIGSDSLSIGEILNRSNGIKLVSIKNSTAQTLLSSNIHLTDFEQVSPLVDIQEGKSHLMDIHRELIRFIYANLDKTDGTSKKILRSVLHDIVYAEEGLLEAHEVFLKQE